MRSIRGRGSKQDSKEGQLAWASRLRYKLYHAEALSQAKAELAGADNMEDRLEQLEKDGESKRSPSRDQGAAGGAELDNDRRTNRQIVVLLNDLDAGQL